MKYLRIPKRIGCHTEGIPERELPSPFRKEGSILRTETFGSHSFEDRPQVPTEAVAEMYFQLAVPLKAVNAVLNEDETEIRTLFLRFLSRCSWMDLALFTKKYTTSGTDGARSSYLRKRRNLMSVNNSTCSTVKPSPQRDINEEGAIFLRQLANLLLENLKLHLDPTQGPAHVLERCEDILLPSSYKRPSNRANTNETEQTTPNNKTITANRRAKTKTDNENSSNGATNKTLTSLHKNVWIALAKGTGVMQNILGLTTPVKGFPKGNCPASERKPRSSARKRLDRPKKTVSSDTRDVSTDTKRRSSRSRKGALTTARPLLANTRLTGETCVKNFADTCYTASGLRAEP